MGAQVLEFILQILEKTKLLEIIKVSLTPQETIELINDINRIRKLKGSSIKQPTQNEIKTKHITSFRRQFYKQGLHKRLQSKEKRFNCIKTKYWSRCKRL